MPSHQHLREFIRERLTAAAEEIFSEFEKTIVRYEEEISQRRLLDISRTHETPEVHGTDLPQQHDCKEKEGLDDQQVCNWDKNSSLDQEDPGPPQIKEEQEELCTSQELVSKQDTEDIVVWAREEPDIVWKPETKLSRMDLPQQHDCKEQEGLDDQQVCNQENCSLDQEDPKLPQTKQEQEELGTNQEVEQLALKLDTKGTIVWTGGALGIMWKPEIILNRIVFPQHKCKEGLVLTDQQVCNQERNSSVDQEDPELPHIKGEQEEFCLSQKGEELVQKPETETFPAHDKGDHSKPEANRDQLLSEPVEEGGEDDNSPRNKCEEVITDPSSHTYEKPHLCSTCGKRFRRLADLKRHMKSHTGEKPHSCSTCGKKFGLMCNLKTHMRIHTGEKPYSCSTCGRRFTRMASLNIHMRIHTGEKPYCCNVCGKRFNHITSLKKHIRIHTGEKPYSCTACGKRLSCVEYLKKHMRTHTGEKPYSCSMCGKSFSQKMCLNIHMRSHTGEKPYSCTTCGKTFYQMSHLKTHMRRKHTVVAPVGKDSL